MCGINGLVILNKSISFNPRKIIKEMNFSLKHRGPDNDGFWSQENVFLGHRRLSILDLSNKSNQPMKIDNLVLTFNGEIYNYIELRKILEREGFRFKTSGDTEVLINAFKFFGKNVCKFLNGMFSFAIYDMKKKQLFLARDPSGQKPLFFYKNHKSFIFSSELKSIVNSKIENFRLNQRAVYQYLAYGHTISPDSMVAGIKKLEPGTCLNLDLDSSTYKIKRYFNYKFHKKSNKPFSYYNSKFNKTFTNSIKRHFRSDVPSAVYLSSGIDSTSILCELASQSSNTQINTITAKFEESDYDESVYAKQISNLFGTNHIEFNIGQADIFSSIFNILDNIDEPMSDIGLVAIHQVAKCAKGRYKVVFSGDGGDELFFGYEPFIKYPFTSILDKFPKFLVNKFLSLLSLGKDDFGYLGLKYKTRLFFNSHKIEHFKKNQCWGGGHFK